MQYLFVCFYSRVFKLDDLGSEILRIAIPASLAMAADPIASLIDTAFMGQLGLLFFICKLVPNCLCKSYLELAQTNYTGRLINSM